MQRATYSRLALRWLDEDEEDIRHKARAGGHKSEESAAAGIESDAAYDLDPCSGTARICSHCMAGVAVLQRAGRSASASARKVVEEGRARETTH